MTQRSLTYGKAGSALGPVRGLESGMVIIKQLLRGMLSFLFSFVCFLFIVCIGYSAALTTKLTKSSPVSLTLLDPLERF